MNHGCRNACALTFAALVFGAASAKSQQHPVAPADTTSSSVKGEASASRHVTNSVEIIHKLDSDVRMRAALGRAKGVFIAPSYRRAVVGVGAAGGTGILLVRRPQAAALLQALAAVTDAQR